jgi:hypothetical protein
MTTHFRSAARNSGTTRQPLTVWGMRATSLTIRTELHYGRDRLRTQRGLKGSQFYYGAYIVSEGLLKSRHRIGRQYSNA